jgi:hypothetical protein
VTGAALLDGVWCDGMANTAPATGGLPMPYRA